MWVLPTRGLSRRDLRVATNPSSSAAPNGDLTEIGRRERELEQLYATARSLTGLGELDDVLASIGNMPMS